MTINTYIQPISLNLHRVILLLIAPDAAPSNFTAVPATSRSATISWDLPPADEQNGVIILYVINVTIVATGQSFQLTSTNTTFTVDDLTPYTNYVCIIAAVTSAGTGPFSTPVTLSTPQDGMYSGVPTNNYNQKYR